MTEANDFPTAQAMRREVRALRDWHMDEAVKLSAAIRGDIAEVDRSSDEPLLVYRPWSGDIGMIEA